MTLQNEDKYICRCEEIKEEEIRQAIRNGAQSLKEIKRWTRAGMGLCQGRSCRRLIERIMAEEMGVPIGEIAAAGFRQPVRPVSIASMDTEQEKEL